jgi:hypothetical protein
MNSKKKTKNRELKRMMLPFVKDGRLKTMCPHGRECMVSSQMCEDCPSFSGKNVPDSYIYCSLQA